MVDFVRSMHETSGLLEELDGGTTLADAEEQVLAYIKEHCPDGSRPPLAGNTVATDRSFLARDMPDAGVLPPLPDRRRLLDQGALAPLVSPRLLRGPDQARQPPRAGRHPGEHRGAALLPRGRLRAPARPRQRPGQGDRGAPRRAADRPRRPMPESSSAPDCPTLPVVLASRASGMVGIAQLVERRLVVADVAGSSPVTHPKKVVEVPRRDVKSVTAARRTPSSSAASSSPGDAASRAAGARPCQDEVVHDDLPG